MITLPWPNLAVTAALATSAVTGDIPAAAPVPALQVVAAYGKLAGPACFGSVAPRGSSCQMTLPYLEEELGLVGAAGSGPASVTREEFGSKLANLPLRWPLKPYGLTEKSLVRTATMNKGAETALYMDELERRGMYDRRNPTGPLPTSLRPRLSAAIDAEGLDPVTVDAVFRALQGGGSGEGEGAATSSSSSSSELTLDQLERAYRGRDALDYYDFLDLIGSGNIAWPRPSEMR